MDLDLLMAEADPARRARPARPGLARSARPRLIPRRSPRRPPRRRGPAGCAGPLPWPPGWLAAAAAAALVLVNLPGATHAERHALRRSRSRARGR